MLQSVLQKHLRFMLDVAKALPFIYFVTYQKPKYHILHAITIKNVLPLSYGCKSNKMLTLHQSLTFFTQMFAKFWFQNLRKMIHEKKFKTKYIRFWVLLRKIYFHVFWNVNIWCRINDCVPKANKFASHCGN